MLKNIKKRPLWSPLLDFLRFKSVFPALITLEYVPPYFFFQEKRCDKRKKDEASILLIPLSTVHFNNSQA